MRTGRFTLTNFKELWDIPIAELYSNGYPFFAEDKDCWFPHTDKEDWNAEACWNSAGVQQYCMGKRMPRSANITEEQAIHQKDEGVFSVQSKGGIWKNFKCFCALENYQLCRRADFI